MLLGRKQSSGESPLSVDCANPIEYDKKQGYATEKEIMDRGDVAGSAGILPA